MKTVTVNLNSIEKVKSGRFAIDAKSIMGIFALDLSKPLQLNIHSQYQGDAIAAALSDYTC